MGHIRHHGIIVTSYDSRRLSMAWGVAVYLFEDVAPISDIHESPINGYNSFCIFPDGAKESADESEAGDLAREKMIAWIDKHNSEAGGHFIDYAEIQYGDDNREAKLLRCSDANAYTD